MHFSGVIILKEIILIIWIFTIISNIQQVKENIDVFKVPILSLFISNIAQASANTERNLK